MVLSDCHVSVEYHDGRWTLRTWLQYWDVACIEISEARAWEICSRYDEAKQRLEAS